MSLLSRKSLLAIGAVVDISLHARGRPVSAKALAARHDLPPRHLEPVLQALVHAGILKGIRGPRGGYELARERRRITAEDIVRAAGSADDGDDATGSVLINEVIRPAVQEAEKAFSDALAHVSVEDMAQRAEAMGGSAGTRGQNDFTI